MHCGRTQKDGGRLSGRSVRRHPDQWVSQPDEKQEPWEPRGHWSHDSQTYNLTAAPKRKGDKWEASHRKAKMSRLRSNTWRTVVPQESISGTVLHYPKSEIQLRPQDCTVTPNEDKRGSIYYCIPPKIIAT